MVTGRKITTDAIIIIQQNRLSHFSYLSKSLSQPVSDMKYLNLLISLAGNGTAFIFRNRVKSGGMCAFAVSENVLLELIVNNSFDIFLEVII
jgi:hypothetical protein